MDYFKLEQIQNYISEIGSKYERDNSGTRFYNDTRGKLQYAGDVMGKRLGLKLTNNYNEKPNKMAGQGKAFVLKEYILTGFIPSHLDSGKDIFVKLSFHQPERNWVFGVDIDVNFSDDNNQYNSDRHQLQSEANWNIPINTSFPQNWEDFFALVLPQFQKQLQYLELFLSGQLNVILMQEKIDLLKYKKQIILQGPPGTGKTYTAKDMAEYMIFTRVSADKKQQKAELEKTEQFELVQFHPSYSYEDFVRGITAKSDGGGITYEPEDKILGKLAVKAKRNLKFSKMPAETNAKRKWVEEKFKKFTETIQDKINHDGKFDINKSVSITEIEEDVFRYFGENWRASHKGKMWINVIIEAYLAGVMERNQILELDNLPGTIKHRLTYYFAILEKFKASLGDEKPPTQKHEKQELKNYVLLIDEINRANLSAVLGELIYALEYRDESIGTIYGIDENAKISLPSNLYIIGTMNTADRSVGHIDYAIKRRFAFINVLPEITPITNERAKQLYREVSSLFVKEVGGVCSNSDFLANDFDFEDVQIGHSYFILKSGSEEEQRAELAMRLKYEIVPLLYEYVKDGLLLESTKVEIQKLSRFGQ